MKKNFGYLLLLFLVGFMLVNSVARVESEPKITQLAMPTEDDVMYNEVKSVIPTIPKKTYTDKIHTIEKNLEGKIAPEKIAIVRSIVSNALKGIDPKYSYSQVKLEGGGMQSTLAKAANNHLGIKYGSDKDCKYCEDPYKDPNIIGTYVTEDNKRYPYTNKYIYFKDDHYKGKRKIYSRFRKFKSTYECVQALANVYSSKHYKQYWKNGKLDYRAASKTYATDKQYMPKIENLADDVDTKLIYAEIKKQFPQIKSTL